MYRVLVPAVVLMTCFGTAAAQGADWASDLFKSNSHDFGTVARAAKTEHTFTFKNETNSTIRISNVRASCGCTTPIVPKQVINPGETGEIIARFNTGSFLGQRGATLTVVFTQPTYREVTLRVDGYVRRDIVCNPGAIEFDKAQLGEKVRREIDIQYAGKPDWKIEAVECKNENIQFELNETRRDSGRVGYKLVAEWEPGVEGYLQDEVTLRTNDRSRPTIPLAVGGQAASAIQVSPQALFLGDVASTGNAQKTLIVRSAEEFRITEIVCEDKRFDFKYSEDAKKLHTIQMSFDPTGIVGEVDGLVKVITDVNANAAVEIQVSGTVVE